MGMNTPSLLDYGPLTEDRSVWAPHRVTNVTHEHQGVLVTLDAELEHGRYAVRRLECRQMKGGSPIDATVLRTVPVVDILAAELRRYILTSQPGEQSQPYAPDPAVAAHGPTDDAMRVVAAVYKVAYAVGQRPTATVAAELGLTRSTASQWVQRARKRGFLGPAEQRKAGEQ